MQVLLANHADVWLAGLAWIVFYRIGYTKERRRNEVHNNI
jgi:hypothetical protein